MKKNKGFTLIELLVVISIIGLLSSVVLAALASSRAKGANASVKANLANARAQAELFYNDNGNAYDGAAASNDVCNSAGSAATGVKGIYKMVDAASVAGGGTAGSLTLDAAVNSMGSTFDEPATQGICLSSATAWVAQAPLKVTESGNNYWCIDSLGVSKGEPALLLRTATKCL